MRRIKLNIYVLYVYMCSVDKSISVAACSSSSPAPKALSSPAPSVPVADNAGLADPPTPVQRLGDEIMVNIYSIYLYVMY